jgi:hypothetical protein
MKDKLSDFIAEDDNGPSGSNAAGAMNMQPQQPQAVFSPPVQQANIVSNAQAQKQANKIAQQQAQTQKEVAGVLVNTGFNVADSVSSIATNIQDWLANLPAPGGIFVILLGIFIFLWLIVPVNGPWTRAQLLWFTLFEERTSIKGSTSNTAADITPAVTTTPVSGSTSSSSGSIPLTVQDFGLDTSVFV